MVYDIYIYILHIIYYRYYIHIYIIIYSVVNQVNACIHGLVMVIPSFFVAVSPPFTLYKDTRPEIWRL